MREIAVYRSEIAVGRGRGSRADFPASPGLPERLDRQAEEPGDRAGDESRGVRVMGNELGDAAGSTRSIQITLLPPGGTCATRGSGDTFAPPDTP